MQRVAQSLPIHIVLVIAAACAVTTPLIWSSGFSATEGHRVIPGWEMLEEGEYLVPHMFGRVYLRKPPGMAWAVAGAGALLGQSELSARLVSIIASCGMALLALGFATAWFGRPWGLVAGLAQALFPMFWPPGRSAEIEALHNFAAMAAVLSVLHLLLTPAPRARASILLTIGLILMAAVKGPAGAPVVIGACAVGLILRRSLRRFVRPRVVIPLIVAAGVITALAILIIRAAPPDRLAQPVTDFIWQGDWRSALLLMPTALLVGLPLTPFVAAPWIAPAKFNECFDDQSRALMICRGLSLTWLLSMLILVALGVDNHRYTMASMVVLAPLAAASIRVVRWRVREGMRAPLARPLLVHRPEYWLVGLLIGAAVYIPISESARAKRSGRAAGELLAPHLKDGAVILADHLVEARPEVLLYARRAASADGRSIECRWVRSARMAEVARPGDYVLLRTDAQSDEPRQYAKIPLETIASGSVHEYTFELRRVR